MSLQSTVNIYNALGIVGDLAFDGPVRAVPYNLVSTPQVNTIGCAFTISSGGNPEPTTAAAPNAGTAQVGGTGVFAGILVNPKAYVTAGTGGNALAATLALPDNSVGELLQMGEIFFAAPAACNVGDVVYYDNTTGVLGTQAPSSSFTGVVATNTLTVSGFVAGGAPLAIGTVISGTGVTPGTVISALGTGTGGNGTYTVNGAATVSSTTMKGSSVAPSGKTLVPNCVVSHYDVAAAGVGVIKLTN